MLQMMGNKCNYGHQISNIGHQCVGFSMCLAWRPPFTTQNEWNLEQQRRKSSRFLVGIVFYNFLNPFREVILNTFFKQEVGSRAVTTKYLVISSCD